MEIGILPDGKLHALTADVERPTAAPAGCTWTAIDLSGEKVGERRFEGPAWLPVYWKGHQLTAITESREDQQGHYQHRSRLVLLDEGTPATLDEFDWECYADRPGVIGDHLWIGVSRGVGRAMTSFAWRWDGQEIKRLPIGRKMDWVSTPIAVQAGVIACEVESFLAKEEQAGAVCFLADGTPVTRSPWIPDGGGEAAGRVFWIRDRLWIHTSRGILQSFVFDGPKLVSKPLPAFLDLSSGAGKDAPGRLALLQFLGEAAAARFDPEARIEWVLPLEYGVLVGLWSFRRFILRRLDLEGGVDAEAALAQGGVSMKKPVRHPLGGVIGLLSDGTVVTIEDARGTTTAIIPALGQSDP